MNIDINSLSPNYRQVLLNRNIIADSISDNNLSGLLSDIGSFGSTSSTTPNVHPSANIEDIGELYKDLMIINNKYQGSLYDYQQITIVNNNYLGQNMTQPYNIGDANIIANSELYNDLNVINNKYSSSLPNDTIINIQNYIPVSTTANEGEYNKDDSKLKNNNFLLLNTVLNKYLDAGAQTLTNIDMTPVVTNKNYSNYLDKTKSVVNNTFGYGTPASSVVDGLLGGILPTFSVGGGNPVFDPASLLQSNSFNTTETDLGIIGADRLAFHLGANVGFNLREETIGNINLNPLSLAMGNAPIVQNFSITVGNGTGGRTLDYLEKIIGFQTPVSMFATSSSIFSVENPVANITRATQQVGNTGRGQVMALFKNLRANLLSQNQTKSGYAPNILDERHKEDGLNYNLYAFSDNTGGVIDMLNGSDNNPISPSSYKLSSMVRDSGFETIADLDEGVETPNDNTLFTWTSKVNNRFLNKKSLLYKTQALFNNENAVLALNTKYVKEPKSEINTGVNNGYIPLGSGVIKYDGVTPRTAPETMFSRTWDTFDRYNKVENLQKHSGLIPNAGTNQRNNMENSVLDNNGFVKITPYGDEPNGVSNIKNYMFSIENLAWTDDSASVNLIQDEIGPNKGRIMWFPPYELSFNENTSTNWEKSQFIGRGEPIYTYNNTERNGTLQFKIIIDHPSYLNNLKGEDNQLINSFFAGEFEVDDRVRSKLSITEAEAIELANNIEQAVASTPLEQAPPDYDVYYPYQETTLNEFYEDGITTDSPLPQVESTNPLGVGGGIGSYQADNGITYVDTTDFGLNRDKITVAKFDELREALNNTCKSCKVTITGYRHVTETENLSFVRAFKLREFFLSSIIDAADVFRQRRVVAVDGGSTGSPDDLTALTGFSETLKNAMLVSVHFESDAGIMGELIADELTNQSSNVTQPINRAISTGIKSRFYNEVGYFRKLKEENKFVYDSISEKITFFQPAFHSVTPEGFNSRLTFLQQCTRQGPTIGTPKETPDNLAFGRPPVCILRVGDFYYTKIIIDSLSFNFEPLIWDLNPEGVGVQPMICTVDLNFAFIGGSSLSGPITKLQNAVSYNYFANTEIYEPRAERYKDGSIQIGSNPTAEERKTNI